MERVMVCAPHPDDAEIGMGGTIASLIKGGVEVLILDLTDGEPTPYGDPVTRAKETKAASKILGIKNRHLLDLTNRKIFDTEENRIKIANQIRAFKPDIMFVPYWEDAHPDHWQACQLCEAARFWAKLTKAGLDFEPHYPRKLLHFFSTHIRTKVEPSFIYDTTDTHDLKIKAINAYRSQFYLNKNNNGAVDGIDLENRFWGRKIGTKFGEPFLCRETISIKHISGLLNV